MWRDAIDCVEQTIYKHTDTLLDPRFKSISAVGLTHELEQSQSVGEPGGDQVCRSGRKLTSTRTVGDSKHFPSKLLFLYLLHKLSALSNEALNPSVLPVSHTKFLSVRNESQAVGDLEGDAPPAIRCTFQNEGQELKMNQIITSSSPSDHEMITWEGKHH